MVPPPILNGWFGVDVQEGGGVEVGAVELKAEYRRFTGVLPTLI